MFDLQCAGVGVALELYKSYKIPTKMTEAMNTCGASGVLICRLLYVHLKQMTSCSS